MKPFMDEEFILENDTAKRLFHEYAENMPVIDYHCHIPPKEIYEDRRFDNLAQVWLGGKNPDGTYFGDHYKWRVMRSAGVSEDYVTGERDGEDRVVKFAEALELAIGNPMVHWCNLELKRYFGVTEPLTSKNAREIYRKCTKMLREDPDTTVRGIIRRSNVKFVGTTDDPVDSLEWHERLSKEKDLGFMVCPSFRPDKALNIGKPGFREYMSKLAESVGKEKLESASDVCDALLERLQFFKKYGCRASDHGLDYIPYRPCDPEEADRIFAKKMSGEDLSVEEAEKYQTTVLLCLAEAYSKLDIVMEIHYSCLRSVNERRLAEMGPDTGFDMIGSFPAVDRLAAFLSALDKKGCCPKTVLFSLNSADNSPIGTLLGCFQTDEIPGKIQQGTAWWFNDTKSGMEEQMRSLMNLGVFGTFIGMLTDSRSFLSYTRHEYFRRIMCNMLGKLVENGEYPANEETLRKIVEGVCCRNAERYFSIS